MPLMLALGCSLSHKHILMFKSDGDQIHQSPRSSRRSGNEDAIKMLLRHGADPSITLQATDLTPKQSFKMAIICFHFFSGLQAVVGAASWGDPDLLKARDSSTLQPAYADILKVLLDAGGPVDQASLTPPDAKIDVMAFSGTGTLQRDCSSLGCPVWP